MEEFSEPQSRNEAILQNILGADNELLPPESRIETLLQMILEQNALNTKNFELVETITVSEADVTSITRSDYDYKRLFIRGRIETSDGTAGVIQTKINDLPCGWWQDVGTGGVADTFAEVMNGMFFAVYGSALTQTTGANTQLVRREVSFGQVMDGNITEIELICENGFPVGTEFEIYGV